MGTTHCMDHVFIFGTVPFTVVHKLETQEHCRCSARKKNTKFTNFIRDTSELIRGSLQQILHILVKFKTNNIQVNY